MKESKIKIQKVGVAHLLQLTEQTVDTRKMVDQLHLHLMIHLRMGHEENEGI